MSIGKKSFIVTSLRWREKRGKRGDDVNLDEGVKGA
jgi:hypothetical protein